MRHAMPSLAITLVLSTLMSRLYLRLTRSRRSTSSWSIPVIIKKKAGQTSESSSTMNHGFYVFLKKKHLSNFLLQQRLVKCMINLDKFRTDDRKMTVISVESISHETDAFLFQLLHLTHCLITWTNNVTHL